MNESENVNHFCVLKLKLNRLYYQITTFSVLLFCLCDQLLELNSNARTAVTIYL